MTKIINIDEIDIEAVRTAAKARYRMDSLINQWTPQRVQIHAIGEEVETSVMGLTLGTQRVVIQIDYDTPLDREKINELLGLEIIYMGRRHVFETMSVDKELDNDGYGAPDHAKAWLDVTYRREAA